MYDWDNSVYQLTITSTIIPIYYNNMTNPANGFIPALHDGSKDFLQEMKVAPLDGYQQELVINSDQFDRPGHAPNVYFYFHANGQYGKGRLGWYRLLDNNKKLQLVGRFHFQTDGSRNLDDGK